MSAASIALTALDPFDFAFVDAVLHMQGVEGQPTAEEARAAHSVLDSYFAALMRAPISADPQDDEWLEGHTLESAAAQFAFLFFHFGVLSVNHATGRQRAAFSGWWATGELPPDLRRG